ncbi:MAG TPA: glycosyltransferase, partial [Paludibacteraceae bacterium]|nr:glycosyltransferase [Paludibacteraceae bacterium]
MNVLFLSAWYPNRHDSMAGLFVQKHAEALSLYADVKVLYVHADKDIKHFEIIIQTHNSITEYLVYYPTKYKFVGGKVGKLLNYLIAYKKGLKSIENELWKPDIIQANVFTRTALVAYFFGLMYHIPYVVIEHWTRYFREKTFSNFLHKFASVWVAKKASAVLPVTHHLQKWMEHHGMKNSNYQVINNVC